MRSTALDKGLRTGVVFGIIIVIMFLIGFTMTGAGLVGKLFGVSSSYSTPALSFFVIFIVLIGAWAGTSASPRPISDPDTLKRALTAGISAGAVSGVLAAVVGFIFGTLNANGIDPRMYLPMVSPESTSLFLLNQSPLTGSLMLLGVLAVSGSVGAVLSFFLRTHDGIRSGARKASASFHDAVRSERVAKVTSSPYARYGFWLLVAALLIILPRTWGGYWNYVFGTVGIYIILGLGLNIITGWAGQLVIGYVAFFAVGAYTFALLTAPEPHNITMNFWLRAWARCSCRRHFWHADRSAHPEPARRLSGDRYAWLCGDHPHSAQERLDDRIHGWTARCARHCGTNLVRQVVCI
jgi:hypothetical protein